MREALKLIADIASGSTTANSLQNIAKIAQEALAQPEQEPVGYVQTVIEALYENGDPISVDAAELLQRISAQPEQEPVAYIHRNEYNEYRLEPHDNFDIKSIPFNIDVPLFKSPQRTWVELTPEDYNWIFEQARTGEHAVQLSEAKLKEKNNA